MMIACNSHFTQRLKLASGKNNMEHAYHIDLLGNSFCKMAMAICMSEKIHNQKAVGFIDFSEKIGWTHGSYQFIGA
jgi:hypothetical protein